MSLARFIGLFFLIGTLLFLFVFNIPKSKNITSIEQEKVQQPDDTSEKFIIFDESNFEFFVYRAHVLSSKNNANILKEKIESRGYLSFVDEYGEMGNLFAIYVGPFLSEDDIVNNMNIIQEISESENGEIIRWKL